LGGDAQAGVRLQGRYPAGKSLSLKIMKISPGAGLVCFVANATCESLTR
jgi:hypothetical protein